MKKKTARRTMADIQQDVTSRIIEQLESGVCPWVRPWKQLRGASNRGNSMPHNAISGAEYSGVNMMLLGLSQDLSGYQSAGWVTFAQAIKEGGSVRKGEKGTRIVKVGNGVKTVFVDDEKEERAFTYLKEYVVFNIEQCDKLPERITKPVFTEQEKAAERINKGVNGLILSHNVNLQHGGQRACFSSSKDRILMPSPQAFKSEADYEATLLHELTHWTGHKNRLNRKMGNPFGSKHYAQEELIAELGAAFMCAKLGVDGKLQHAEYVASWLKVLKNDKKAIFTASSAARKAAEYLTKADEKQKDQGEPRQGDLFGQAA